MAEAWPWTESLPAGPGTCPEPSVRASQPRSNKVPSSPQMGAWISGEERRLQGQEAKVRGLSPGSACPLGQRRSHLTVGLSFQSVPPALTHLS